MKFKIDAIVQCEVHVWGYVEADSMEDAIEQVKTIGTGSGYSLDHEIISDIKTLSVEVKEVQA